MDVQTHECIVKDSHPARFYKVMYLKLKHLYITNYFIIMNIQVSISFF